jgi:hypothetical protein
MNILYYVTAHGYGHGLRTCAVSNEFSERVHLTFRTSLPENFFRAELRRPFDYLPARFDCGCVQKDSITIDAEKTLALYKAVARENERRLEEEIRWCRERRIKAIVSDITPFAFEVARGAGIPSVAVGNFTWSEIYAPYVRRHSSYKGVLAKIRGQYGYADLLLELAPAMDMGEIKNREKIPPVGRVGRNIRPRLVRKLQRNGTHIGLIYPGGYGMSGIRWERLAGLPDWDFIGIYPLPGAPGNYHLLKEEGFRYQDLVASADVVISKLGYGTVAESLLNGTSLIYPPRSGFAEHPVLEKAVHAWGHGFPIAQRDYRAVNWKPVLDSALTQGKPQQVKSDGARLCARRIEEIAAKTV